MQRKEDGAKKAVSGKASRARGRRKAAAPPAVAGRKLVAVAVAGPVVGPPAVAGSPLGERLGVTAAGSHHHRIGLTWDMLGPPTAENIVITVINVGKDKNKC